MHKPASGALRRAFLLPADRLSEVEVVDMMLPPRLHLDCLIAGATTPPDYLTSIAGVFNVATALACLHRDRHAISFYEAALKLLLEIARQGGADEAGARRLVRYFNAADDYLAGFSRPALMHAIQLVQHQIRTGQATPLLAA